MKILASREVCEGGQINILHRHKEAWVVLSRDEFDPTKLDDEKEFFVIEEAYLYNRIPNLKGKLKQPVNTTINIDYNTGEINVNKHHRHLGIPTHGAKATRQANAGFSFIHYVKTNHKYYLTFLLGLIIIFGCGFFIHWLLYLAFIPVVGYYTLELLKIRDMFYSGALLPGIVIDAENRKIAVLTDLSLGFGEYPIIRIKRITISKKYLKNGNRIPIAGAYQNTKKYSHWNYFEPLPIPAGINNEAKIQEKINQIPTAEWLQLQNEIKKYKEIPLEGYYPLDIENNAWKDINLEEIVWMQFGEEKKVKKADRPKFSFMNFLSMYKMPSFLVLLTSLIFIAIIYNGTWGVIFPLVIMVLIYLGFFAEKFTAYTEGLLFPGYVINANIGMVGIFANVKINDGTFPVLIITKMLIPNSCKKNGSKIPVFIKMDNKDKRLNYNNKLRFIAANINAKGQAMYQEFCNKFSDDEWNNVSDSIKSLNGKYEVNVFPKMLNSSSWKETNIDATVWDIK